MKPKKEPEAAEPTEVQEIRSLIAATKADGVAVANAFCGIRWIAARALAWHRELISTTDMFEARIAQQDREIGRIDTLSCVLMGERDEARAALAAARAEMHARTYYLGADVDPPSVPCGWEVENEWVVREWDATDAVPAHEARIEATGGDPAWVWRVLEGGAGERSSESAPTLAAAMAAGEAAVKARREVIAAAQPALDSAPVP